MAARRYLLASAAALALCSVAGALPLISYAPDKPISYAALVGGVSHVFVTSAGVTTQLTSGADKDETPDWSPDGTKIAFQRSGSGVNGSAVMIMNADGSGLTDISPSPGADILPTWTPDGKILFSWVVQQNPTETAIMRMDASGANRTLLLSPNATTILNVAAHMSPDGTIIAFDCGAAFGAAFQICTINADGSNQQFLTTVPNFASADPHWSFDGAKIVFASNRDGTTNVYTMTPAGASVTQLTHFASPFEAGDAGYSPDGTKLVFEWDNGGNGQSDPAAPAEVQIMNYDGSNQISLHWPCSDVGCAPRFKPR